MADVSWSDPSTWIGGGGLLAIAAAAVKTGLDWSKDKGGQRATSEDLVRDDLLATIREQRTELTAMRTELAAARVEMREADDRHRAAIRACEDRAERFLEEMRRFHSENDQLRGRYHRLANYVGQVTMVVDVDRAERGLEPLPIPSWIDETILGPTATKQDRPKKEKPG